MKNEQSNKQEMLERFRQHQQEVDFLRNQLSVTDRDYKGAVEYLVSHAKSDTSGSRAAAQVLLSLYNGSNWHMDLTDLCVMDFELFSKALIVIRGRVILSEEPHNVIEDGNVTFAALEEHWQHLHTRNRYSDKE